MEASFYFFFYVYTQPPKPLPNVQRLEAEAEHENNEAADGHHLSTGRQWLHEYHGRVLYADEQYDQKTPDQPSAVGEHVNDPSAVHAQRRCYRKAKNRGAGVYPVTVKDASGVQEENK